MPTPLIDICNELEYIPPYCVEIGVGLPHQTRMKDFWEVGAIVEMFEALPEYYNALVRELGLNPLITIHNVALCDKEGEVSIYSQRDSSFIEGINSPHCVNDGYGPRKEDIVKVQGKTFEQFDNGNINLLALDIEGAEWYVISRLISRPKIIAVETHNRNYTNRYLPEIEKWMSDNNYKLHHREDRNGSDSFYVL